MTGPSDALDLGALPGLATQDGAPVFDAPWQAQAFAMVVHLHDTGAFSWDDWAACLSAEIHSGAVRPYYEHWLAALERIVAHKGLADPAALAETGQAWQDAAARTPHGRPIVLK